MCFFNTVVLPILMRPLSKLLNITIIDKEATEFFTNEILKVLNSSEPSIQKVIYQSTVISSLKTNQFKGAKNNAFFWLSIGKYLDLALCILKVDK